MVISPFAKSNYVSHQTTDQSSVIRFIEDNWLNGQRMNGTSMDAVAGTLVDMLNFTAGPSNPALILDPTSGQPTAGH